MAEPEGVDHRVERGFERTYGALAGLFAFVEEFFAREGIDDRFRYPVDLAVEEIFTNMVKYHPEGTHAIRVRLSREGDRLEVALADRDVNAYDPTTAPVPDTSAPLDGRRPGGLGLHLVRQVVDRIDYAYADRTSTITFVKTLR